MPMKSPNKIMGKVKTPSFFKSTGGGSSTSKTSPLKRNLPVLLALVLVGVAIILFLRSRSTTTSTGPALNLVGTSAPDQSTIDNLTASVLALQGLQPGNSSTASGGTSTPIVTPPDTTPGTSNNNGSSTSSGYNTNYPSPSDSTPFSNTAAANAELVKQLLASGIGVQKPGFVSVDTGALAKAPQSLKDLYTNATGVPVGSSIVNPSTGTPTGNMAQFSGVVGTTSNAGMVYNVYKNGVLQAAVQGTGTTDTAALAAKYGVG